MVRVSGRLTHYAAAAVLVRLADEGARVVLTLLALQRTGSAAVGGVLVAALLVPHVVAAPLVGALADRARRPRLVVAAAGCGFAAALAATATGLGRLPLTVLVGVLLAGGCCGPALTGALTSQLPGLVPAQRLPRAFGLDSLTYNGAGIVGPAAGAAIAAASSPAGATYALAGSAGLGAALAAVLPVPVRAHQQRATRRIGYLLGGTKLLVRDRVLATVTAATSIGQLGMGALPVIAVLIATQHHSAAAAGWLLTAVATGGLFGSLAWTWRPGRPERASTVVMLGLVGVGLPLGAAAFSSSLPLTATFFALAGFSNGPLFGALLVTRNDHAPTNLRSQIFTLGAGAKITATAAGAALGGLLAGHTSVAVLLLLAAASPLLAGALGRVLLPRTATRHPMVDRTEQGATTTTEPRG